MQYKVTGLEKIVATCAKGLTTTKSLLNKIKERSKTMCDQYSPECVFLIHEIVEVRRESLTIEVHGDGGAKVYVTVVGSGCKAWQQVETSLIDALKIQIDKLKRPADEWHPDLHPITLSFDNPHGIQEKNHDS